MSLTSILIKIFTTSHTSLPLHSTIFFSAILLLPSKYLPRAVESKGVADVYGRTVAESCTRRIPFRRAIIRVTRGSINCARSSGQSRGPWRLRGEEGRSPLRASALSSTRGDAALLPRFRCKSGEFGRPRDFGAARPTSLAVLALIYCAFGRLRRSSASNWVAGRFC